MGQSVESFVGAYFAKLDGLIGGLTKKTYWTLWVGAIAIVLSLAANAPYRASLLSVGDWPADVFRIQIAHPFTPIDLEPFKSIKDLAPEWFMHLDKIAFRFSIPLIGKVFNLGAASFLVLNYAAGGMAQSSVGLILLLTLALQNYT
jgi:hypothetical protein